MIRSYRDCEQNSVFLIRLNVSIWIIVKPNGNRHGYKIISAIAT